MIEALEVHKSFGRKEVLRGVTLIAEKGVHALVGPNGSGKTTLIKVILGLLKPTKGAVRLFDAKPEEGRKFVGYVGERHGLREASTLWAELSLYCEAKGCSWDEVREAVDAWGLRPYLKERVSNLSFGTRQRVAIARSLLGKPRALIWDEALKGLDPEWRALALDYMRDFGKRGLVLYSTHVLEELEEVADEVTLLVDGKTRFSGPLWELLDSDEVEVLIIGKGGRRELVVKKDEVPKVLCSLNGFSAVRVAKPLRKLLGWERDVGDQGLHVG